MKIPNLSIVSIGPGDVSLLNQETLNHLHAASPLILRTDHHPLSIWLKEQGIVFSSLDDLYDQYDDFDTLCEQAAKRVSELSQGGKHPVYAVPDMLSDRTVDYILSDHKELFGNIILVPGFSYADYFLSQCRSYFRSGSIRIVTASELISTVYDPAETVLVTEIDNEILAGDLKTFLIRMLDDEAEVVFLQEKHAPVKILLYELDRQKHYNHMTALLLPAAGYLQRSRHTIHDLVTIMDRLRAPDGCPWDKLQTHHSLQPYMIEEAWESVIAMDENDPDHMADELGDLLFQIVFHASIGKSFGEFDLTDVVSSICNKMIRRHPHVFDAHVPVLCKDLSDQWDMIKRSETGHLSFAESIQDISSSLPSLKYADKFLKKISLMNGYQARKHSIISSMKSLLDQIEQKDDSIDQNLLAQMLLMSVQLARAEKYDAELLLHKTVDQKIREIKTVNEQLLQEGKSLEDLTFMELCVYLKHVEDEIE